MKTAFACLLVLLIVLVLAGAILKLADKFPFYTMAIFSIFVLLLIIDVLIEGKGILAIISASCALLFIMMVYAFIFASAVTEKIPYYPLILFGALATAIITYIMVRERSQMLAGLPIQQRKEV